MSSLFHRSLIGALVFLLCALVANAQQGGPQVTVPTVGQLRPPVSTSRILYPWKTFVTATIFWVGEQPTQNNPVPNCKSAWDMKWMQNFGGYDNPNPKARIANHTTGDFRPKAFTPKLNPFYIALPYNDIASGGTQYKTEAERVIPWFHRVSEDGRLKSTLKGRWVEIHWKGRSCYAQWEDTGPWVTDDWRYVFGDKPPRNRYNKSAGIDISPSIRDYLQLKSGDKVHWRFVEAGQVPHGPWKRYGFEEEQKRLKQLELDAQRKYLEYLRKLRDKQFMERPIGSTYR